MNTNTTLKDLLKSSNSRMMTITFVKKDGFIRKIYAKTGVRTSKGKVRSTKKRKQNPSIFIVFDCQLKEKRCFRLDSVLEVLCGDMIYRKN